MESEVQTTYPLVISIVTTVLCCLPLGVVGIVFAAMAMSKKSSGENAVAADYAKKAKLFSYIGIGLGVVSWIVVVAVNALAVGAAAAGAAAGSGGTP